MRCPRPGAIRRAPSGRTIPADHEEPRPDGQGPDDPEAAPLGWSAGDRHGSPRRPRISSPRGPTSPLIALCPKAIFGRAVAGGSATHSGPEKRIDVRHGGGSLSPAVSLPCDVQARISPAPRITGRRWRRPGSVEPGPAGLGCGRPGRRVRADGPAVACAAARDWGARGQVLARDGETIERGHLRGRHEVTGVSLGGGLGPEVARASA